MLTASFLSICMPYSNNSPGNARLSVNRACQTALIARLQQLIAELRRRRIFRTAGMYVVVGLRQLRVFGTIKA